MSTMVQIRSVPEALHRRLKARAALEGMSMSEYVLRELKKALDRPSRQEILDRLSSQPVRRLRRSAGRSLGTRLADPALSLHAPHLLDVEVTQALRRYVRDGDVEPEVARRALNDLRDLDIERHAHEPLRLLRT